MRFVVAAGAATATGTAWRFPEFTGYRFVFSPLCLSDVKSLFRLTTFISPWVKSQFQLNQSIGSSECVSPSWRAV